MRNKTDVKIVSAILVLAVLALGVALYVRFNPAAVPETATEATATPEPASGVASDDTSSSPQHPVPAANESSDETVGGAKPAALTQQNMGTEIAARWKSFFGKEEGQELLRLENFVRHFVLMFENATETKIPAQASIFESVNGDFKTTTLGDKVQISEQNFRRYDSYAELLKSADLKKLVSFYQRMYPLLQAGYAEMGRKGYFNDRVVDVLDQIIGAKDPSLDTSLVIDGGRFVFEDAELEAAPAVQKVLFRIGPAHSALVKERMKELRALLVSSQ
ncbi:DUF3014 domain-containing protein [Bdellovibrio sp. SKB1291214]|uniref:DUF3014 domain-containing protein n=1 Tax=Bdellovibrio sp. SKB1291214 TaxID=1732569 RepID=UPI0015961C14|nr:DUF3014 domain-containing protein [Bdellovibrio sp. SKB1291214]UYL09913.1 DUF3014 domain-containing protein [Bdellovibrio sp. SKB1291214]